MKTSLNPTYLKALWLYQQKKWQAAANELQKVRQQDPNNAKALFKLGMCHYRLKQWIRAADRMTEALALAPQNQHWTVQQQKAVKESVKSKLTTLKANTKLSATQKEDQVRDLLALDYNNAELHNELAHALRKQGKWWQEVEALTQATSLKPQFPTWHYRLGEALEAMNRFQQAAAAYGTAIELKKGKAEALWHYRQGFCYEREGHDGAPNPAAAQKAYQQATAKDATLNAKRYGIGVFHQSRGYWPQALAAYSQQWQQQPWDAELCYRTGMAHDRCYDWSQAEDWYKKALSIQLDKPQWHYRLGFVLERQEKYPEAAQAYEYAATHAEKHTPYWFYRWGYVLDKAGRHEEAVQAFLRTKELQTLDAPLDAPIYLQQVNSHQFIADTLEEVLRHDTTHPEHWYQLGNAYERLENWEKAADAYGHAVKRSNDHRPTWYYRLGYALAQINNFKIACEQLRHTWILQKAYGVSHDKFNKDAGFRQAATYTEYYEGLEIQPKTVLYESFHGASMSCNPYALFLYLVELDKLDKWQHIWVVNSTSNILEKFKNKKNVIFIKRNSDAYLRQITQVNILINNVSFPEYYTRKESQIYLNTWHGTPIKYLGKDIKDDLLGHKNVARNLLQASHVLSQNEHTTDALLNRYDVSSMYSGKVAEIGYPRIDITINLSSDRLNKIRSLCKAEGKKIVLYAPTWRGEHGKASINVKQLKSDLQSLASESYAIAFRGHHMLESQLVDLEIKAVTVVPSDIDTNELLAAVDLLVTDYSSIAFDFLITKKPIVYYTYDVKEYEQHRGLYFSTKDLPGTTVAKIEDVKSAIHNYLTEAIQYKLGNSIEVFCGHDDGRVSAKVWDWLLHNDTQHEIVLANKDKYKLLFYMGPFIPNGILTSWFNLIEQLDQDKFAVTLAVEPAAIKSSHERILQYEKKPEFVQVLGRCGRFNFNIEEDWLNDKFSVQQKLIDDEMYVLLSKAYEREYIRCFGLNSINAAVHFEGYNKKWASIFAGAPKCHVGNRVIYQHNHKLNEWIYRFPYLEAVFNHYRWYDKLVSVSQQTGELNASNLIQRFQLEESKFCYCDNVQNPEKVSHLSKMPCDLLVGEPFLNNGDKVFVTLGRLSIEKDHQKLIKAFANIVKCESKVKLLILGDGPLKNELSKIIIDLGLQNVVKLMGRVDNPFPILNKADCFVLSSNHEGQPMVLFEAMILKKPIIATDIIGSRSVIERRSGHLVENSQEGLTRGMLDFLDGKLNFPEYDIAEYQKQALEMFYTNVCEY